MGTPKTPGVADDILLYKYVKHITPGLSEQEEEHAKAEKRVNDLIQRLRSLRKSRQQLVRRFLQTAGFVSGRFNGMDLDQLTEAYYDQNFRAPLVELGEIADKIKDLKFSFKKSTEEMGIVTQLMLTYRIKVDMKEFQELISLMRLVITPRPDSDYYAILFGTQMEKLLHI